MIKTEMQRRLERALDVQRQEREAREQREVDEQAERERRNAATRKEYLAKLAAERAAKQAEADARLDQELEGQKTRSRNQWLADHPYKSNADFEQVWKQHLRPNAVADLERQAGEQVKARLRASGQYQF